VVPGADKGLALLLRVGARKTSGKALPMPQKYTRAWYRALLEKHCAYYGLDVQGLEELALAYFLQAIKNHPDIELGQPIRLIPRSVRGRDAIIPDDKFWEEGPYDNN
jgi:hypothetical protein